MTKQSQMEWVKSQLTENKKVSRNEALRRRITRLSARILDLREAGWDIQAQSVKTENGRDYIYLLNT